MLVLIPFFESFSTHYCILLSSLSTRFPSFVNIKTVDEEGLAKVVPEVWWAAKEGPYSCGNKDAYDYACQNIVTAVQGMVLN